MNVRIVSGLLIGVWLAGGWLIADQPGRPQADRKAAGSGANQGTATKSEKSESSQKPSARRARGLTPGREAAALTFARLHHPELADLLEQLKKTNRPEYRRAIRDLFQESERLARLQENAPERYELAIEAWTLDSRIRLLAARMTMSDDPAFETELKSLLQQRVALRLEDMKRARDRLQQRLERLNAAIEKIEQDPEAAATRDLQRVKRSLRAKQRKPDTQTETEE